MKSEVNEGPAVSPGGRPAASRRTVLALTVASGLIAVVAALVAIGEDGQQILPRFALSAVIADDTRPELPAAGGSFNRLSGEKSPYLLQHAGNPIWWYPWGQMALDAAARENKPIFLSIGYSSCYWCHFMEKDSFEQEDVAAILNEHFVSIKVDREERPDVDNIYMKALLVLRGSGGWPISIFLTPDGVPFWGASTIPREQFKAVAAQIGSLWKNDSEKIEVSSRQVADVLRQLLYPDQSQLDVGEEELLHFLDIAGRDYDEKYGGFGTGTKFPRPHLMRALLRIHERTGNKKALDIALHTLKAIARGGMHDVIGGGFHRYSVDREWNVPHFEKMLYDNAGLPIAYFQAYEITKDAELLRVARATLDWTLSEMTHPEGGFYSARDAGEYEEEGDYYTWRIGELKSLLSEGEFAYAKSIFQLSEQGNFEGNRNVINLTDGTILPDERIDNTFRSIKEKLTAARGKRKEPRLDDKILTSWNGLMIGAMAVGSRVANEERYLFAARDGARFILERLTTSDGRLLRRWREGDKYMGGVLNDYAYFIYGLIELYLADGNRDWLARAETLQAKQDLLFWDKARGGYFFDNNDDGTLLFRSKEYEDMAIPSGNSIAAYNLLRLGKLTDNPDLSQRGKDVIRSAGVMIRRSPFALSQMLVALEYSLGEVK